MDESIYKVWYFFHLSTIWLLLKVACFVTRIFDLNSFDNHREYLFLELYD